MSHIGQTKAYIILCEFFFFFLMLPSFSSLGKIALEPKGAAK